MARKPTYEELEQRVKDLEAGTSSGKKAMEDLRQEAERFREFARLLPEIVFEVNESGILTFINQKAFEIAGYSQQDFDKGFQALNLLTPECREEAEQRVRTVLAGEEVGIREYTAQRKDGSTFPVLVRSTPVLRDGVVVGLRGFVLDITEQKRAAEALRESEEKYRQLFLTESDALLVLHTDTGEFVDVNEAALALYGYNKEEFAKLKVTDISAEPEQTWQDVQEHRKRGGTGTVPLHYHRKKDGTIFPVEISTSIFMLQGRQVLCGAIRDISARIQTEEELRKHQHGLETLVAARTADLQKANTELRQEIATRKRVEEALRASEAKYRTLVEHMPALVYTARLDEASTTEYISPQVEGILGFTQEDYRRDPDTWRKALHPDDRDRVLVEVAQAREKGDPLTTEYRMIDRNGKTIWFRNHARIIHDDRGEPLFLQGVMLDITIPKQVGEALHESEERFRTVFEGSLDAIILVDPETGEILDANPTTCEWIHLEQEELIGVSYLNFVDPGSVAYAKEMFGNVARDEALGIPREISARRPDGTSIVFEALGQLIQIDGKPVVLIVLRDITARRRTESALRESESRYRRLFDESPVALWEVDASALKTYVHELQETGVRDFMAHFENHPLDALNCFRKTRVTDTNKANLKLFEAESKEAFQKSSRKIVIQDQDTIRMCAAEVTNLAEGKTASEVEDVTVLTFGGKQKRVFYRWTVAPGYERTYEKVLVSVLDITDRKRMEQELQKIQKLESIGILAGGLAHDFNNILTAISTNLSMARLYGELRDDISTMLTDAEEASMRAQSLTQQLLAFSKGGTPIKKTVSIAGLIKNTAEFALSGSNARCEFVLPKDLWLLEADEGQIGQVIQNLVINADQAMPRGGTIRVVAENVLVAERDLLPLNKGLHLRIAISDQGTGISKKDMPNIFDPFFTTKQRGSGLGLTTAFSIVNNHGGHIEVESVVAEGTTFKVYLPSLGRTSGERERRRWKLIKGEGRILLVDDEEIIWRATGEALTRMGYEVRFAEDGAAGIELYQEAMNAQRPFQAVIMDLTIPGGMGGKETIGRLLRIDPEAKIIASSGYSNDPVMSDYQDYGFCGVITKPYRIEELGDLLSRITNGVKDRGEMDYSSKSGSVHQR